MRRLKIVVSIAIIVLLGMAAWQIGSWELANVTLQEDMRDMAALAGTRIGFKAPDSDEEVTQILIRKAKDHGIDLQPNQITVRHTTTGQISTLYLAADYTVPVNLLFFSFWLHFTPASNK
jgi:hypothetical protein